jgi:hypothetical protein
MTETTRRRVFWKPDQWQLVGKRSFLIRKDPLFNGTDIEAVRIAQREVLPADKQRPLISMQEVCTDRYDIREMWKELMKQGYGSDQGAILPTIPPQQRPVTLSISDIGTDDLMKELFKRMLETMSPDAMRKIAREEANAVIDRRVPGLLPADTHVEPEKEIERVERRHKVCILGLDGAQQEQFRKEYGRIIDFHFLSGAEGGNRIKSTAGMMDFTIQSKWCKGTLGSTSGWPNFSSAGRGGLETIKRQLNQRFKLN